MNKIKRLMDAPFSDQMFALTQFYWQLKTRIYYRFMFKSLGAQTVIYDPMLISNGDCIDIGDHVSIRNGVRLQVVRDPYGRTPTLKIGSNTLIEQGVQIVCHNRVIIGRDVSITGRCAIVDVTHPYQDLSIGNMGFGITDEDSFVEIEDGAFLGYGAVILPNVRIGKRAVIGANSVVTRDVPPYSIAIGAPATVVRTYSQQPGMLIEPSSERSRL